MQRAKIPFDIGIVDRENTWTQIQTYTAPPAFTAGFFFRSGNTNLLEGVGPFLFVDQEGFVREQKISYPALAALLAPYMDETNVNQAGNYTWTGAHIFPDTMRIGPLKRNDRLVRMVMTDQFGNLNYRNVRNPGYGLVEYTHLNELAMSMQHSNFWDARQYFQWGVHLYSQFKEPLAHDYQRFLGFQMVDSAITVYGFSSIRAMPDAPQRGGIEWRNDYGIISLRPQDGNNVEVNNYLRVTYNVRAIEYAARGDGAAYWFNDRLANTKMWALYSAGGFAYLYNNVANANVITFDEGGGAVFSRPVQSVHAGGSSYAGLQAVSATPFVSWYETDGSLNNKWWDMGVIGGAFYFRGLTDGETAADNIISIARTDWNLYNIYVNHRLVNTLASGGGPASGILIAPSTGGNAALGFILPQAPPHARAFDILAQNSALHIRAVNEANNGAAYLLSFFADSTTPGTATLYGRMEVRNTLRIGNGSQHIGAIQIDAGFDASTSFTIDPGQARYVFGLPTVGGGDFSGLLLVNSLTWGNLGMFVCGGGLTWTVADSVAAAKLFSHTAADPNRITVYYASGNNYALIIQNNTSVQHTIRIFGIRTRAGA